MIVTPIKLGRLVPPKDNLIKRLEESLLVVPEKSILVISSKVISIHEGRCVPIGSIPKHSLAQKEAELFIQKDNGFFVTIKNGMLVTSAGIDESNGNGFYILHPNHPNKSAQNIWEWVKKTFAIKEVGVVIADSCSLPLRRGSVGISIGSFGFKPLRDYRKKKDLFGREFHVSQYNVVDSLAASAVSVMGEGDESIPVALISDVSDVSFIDYEYISNEKYGSLYVSVDEDKYGFLKKIPWEKGEGGYQQ